MYIDSYICIAGIALCSLILVGIWLDRTHGDSGW
jgi:hypothetical protein